MDLARRLALLLATTTSGLVAGLLLAFAVAVMPALRRVDDRTFVEVMQRVNVAILNGWFLVPFVGALLTGAVAAAVHLPAGSRAALPWVLLGCVLYAVALGVTGLVNVPLNDALAAAGNPASLADPAAVRTAFEDRWVTWHLVRTVAATGALGCFAWGCLLSGRLP
jgi:uncharacterized membrane protein